MEESQIQKATWRVSEAHSNHRMSERDVEIKKSTVQRRYRASGEELGAHSQGEVVVQMASLAFRVPEHSKEHMCVRRQGSVVLETGPGHPRKTNPKVR